MGEISIRTLSQATSEVLARVKRGEQITITDCGEVIARIIPVSANPLLALINAGSVQPATSSGLAPRPTILAREGVDAGTLLQGMRAEERY